MAGNPVVLIADRSRLAANLFRLLISPMGASLVARRSLREAVAGLRRGIKVDLMIASTNAMGGRPDELLPALGSGAAARMKKIFLCTDSKSDQELARSLEEIPNSSLMSRPFEPSELAGAIRSAIEGKGR